uniref:Retroviral polymerase SH3-like domain-containing protein n=1 Tax=Lactuca sativa TaxID=4236 RepID=A0A9R1WUI9_LACSA|nr:hypothetical protein LSAT_V11C900499560 [Lactuca sativa]
MNKRKPNIKFFHMFVFRCNIKKNRVQIGKFSPKADEGIFLGYCLHVAAYRVLNKRTGVIEEGSDVTYDESYVRVLDPNHFGPQMVVPIDKMNQSSPANISTPVHGIEVDFESLFLTQSSTLESKNSQKQGETPLDGSILKGTLQSSQPSNTWFHEEPHSTGSTPSSSFTSTPSIEFKHATVEEEPPVSGRSKLFQDDVFEGTFSSVYPPRPKEQYETIFTPQILKETQLTKWTKDHPTEQIIGDTGSEVVTRLATKNEYLYASFISMIEAKGIKEAS